MQESAARGWRRSHGFRSASLTNVSCPMDPQTVTLHTQPGCALTRQTRLTHWAALLTLQPHLSSVRLRFYRIDIGWWPKWSDFRATTSKWIPCFFNLWPDIPVYNDQYSTTLVRHSLRPDRLRRTIHIASNHDYGSHAVECYSRSKSHETSLGTLACASATLCYDKWQLS